MDATDSREELSDATESSPGETIVCCHETRPGRHVFTERGNTDGWISADIVVPVHQ
ncbi:hypothetical protein [Halovivax cerinus]|uniref:Uncharacterized protein n=1 Tax=Halovivax cerinus TaxID=1487865 RepID=A0ABD5NNP8_9EURY|nr:hypothetical protein [Halovivax cerinus]